jgi:hypothetical protein
MILLMPGKRDCRDTITYNFYRLECLFDVALPQYKVLSLCNEVTKQASIAEALSFKWGLEELVCPLTSLGTNRRNTLRPWLCLFKLSSKAYQSSLITISADKLHTNRQALIIPVERN